MSNPEVDPKEAAALYEEHQYTVWWAARFGHTDILQRVLTSGGGAGDLLAGLPRYVPSVQVVVLSSGEFDGLPVDDLARQGVCPEALCVLLDRQGYAEAAALLTTTQMLEPLAPEARAELLADLLEKQLKPENMYV